MKKIKVLMLGWEYPPYFAGGLGTHVYNLTKELSKLGVKIYFINPHLIHKKRGNLEVIGLDVSRQFKEDGKITVYGRYRLRKIAAFTKKIKEVLKYEFDIIHCQDEHPIDASILLKKLTKKPLLLTVHSTSFDKSKSVKIRRFTIEKKGMKNADKIIAVSNFTKQIMVKRYKIDPEKILVIPNAVNQRKLPPKKKEGKIRYVLCLGRLTYQKGLPYLLEAAAKVVKKDNNVRFLLVGEGHERYVRKLRYQVRKLRLERYVRLLGYVKDRDYCYRKAHIFVMPSVSEPFGITPLEAISNGTPAIISRQSGVSELLKSCLKIDYWDTNDLAKKILFLVNNKKAYERLRKQGLKEIKKFTWQDTAKRTLKVYKDILNSDKS